MASSYWFTSAEVPAAMPTTGLEVITVSSSSRPRTRDNDVYTLFDGPEGTPVGVTAVRLQQPTAGQDNRLPRITVAAIPDTRNRLIRSQVRRHRNPVLDDSDPPFSGGFCRQLAAMYTDVGMTTVERVRWLCGWMVLVYALTCYAWFAWPAYPVPAVGILSGIVGLLVCQRPHAPGYLSYVTTFLVINYAQLALLVWIVLASLTVANNCLEKCAGIEAKTIFMVLLALATGAFHWRVAQITRLYVREFRMIEQLALRGSRLYRFDSSYSSAAASSTIATDVQSSLSVSGLSASMTSDALQEVYALPVLQADPVSVNEDQATWLR